MPAIRLKQLIAGGVCTWGVFVASSCWTTPDIDDDLDDPKAVAVHAGLEDVQVSPAPAVSGSQSRKFLLSAWYLNKKSNTVVGPDLRWGHTVPNGSVDPTSGEVSISGPTSGAATGDVWASNGSMKDIVKVRLWPSPEAATLDGDVLVLADPLAAAAGVPAPAGRLADPPSIALVEHSSSSGCQWDKPLAFVGAVSVGEQTTIPCSVSVFSQDDSMQFQDGITDSKWLQKGARFNLSRTPPVSIKITVFLTAAPQASNNSAVQSAGDLSSDLETLARNDVAQAEMILSTNRTGLKIDATYKPLSSSDDLAIRIGADPYDCVLTPNLPADPAKNDYAYNPSTVSVYYVERINYPLDPVQPRVRGIQCHHWYSGNPAVGSPPGRGPVVFISYTHHSPVTLAHELGHALGLKDDVGELGNRDVMHNLLPDGPLGADARSHLTIGQVFRMNVWDDSWINTRLPKPGQRACDNSHPCPEIRWNPDAY